jgi:putative transposase
LWQLWNHLEDNEIEFKYDPEDVSKIYVYDSIFKNDYIEVLCNDLAYAEGLTLDAHKEIQRQKKLLKGLIDEDARAKVMSDLIDKETNQEETETKKARRNKSKYIPGSNQESNPVSAMEEKCGKYFTAQEEEKR